MVAAKAAGFYDSLHAAAEGMQQGGRQRKPNPAARPRFDADYEVFLKMHAQRRELDAITERWEL